MVVGSACTAYPKASADRTCLTAKTEERAHRVDPLPISLRTTQRLSPRHSPILRLRHLARVFNLDDLRAQVAQQHGADCARQQARQVEDASVV